MLDCLDKHGRVVSVGSYVRLIELSPLFLASLPPDELEDVRSMIGEVFEVYEVDKYGCAWVEKGWSYPERGQCMGHSLGLEAKEMELIEGS